MTGKPHGVFCLEETVNRLRETRVIKRITQFQLRVATGIHQSRISLIENGLIDPREDEKQRLSKALQVKPEKIWEDETDCEKGEKVNS